MNYAVYWTPEAEDGLADVWLAAVDRSAVNEASDRIDQQLARHPFACGVRRDASVNRTLVDRPLGVDYEIIEDDKKVRVLRVWTAP